jgi:hypothetical protein
MSINIKLLVTHKIYVQVDALQLIIKKFSTSDESIFKLQSNGVCILRFHLFGTSVVASFSFHNSLLESGWPSGLRRQI